MNKTVKDPNQLAKFQLDGRQVFAPEKFISNNLSEKNKLFKRFLIPICANNNKLKQRDVTILLLVR